MSEQTRPGVGDGGAEPMEVVVLGLELDLLRRAQAWDDALLREVQLMARGGPRDERVRLDELWADLDRIEAVFSALRPALVAALEEASDPRELRLVADRSAAGLAAEALEAFARLDARCGGILLLSPPSAEVRGLRTWFLEQVTGQAVGRAPVAWEEWWDRSDGPDGSDRSDGTDGTDGSDGDGGPAPGEAVSPS